MLYVRYLSFRHHTDSGPWIPDSSDWIKDPNRIEIFEVMRSKLCCKGLVNVEIPSQFVKGCDKAACNEEYLALCI